MLRGIAQSILAHLSHHSRWEHAGLYGALLTGLVWVYWWWPVDPEYFDAFIDHPELIELERGVLQTALAFAAILGVIGLLRPGIFQRACGLIALNRAQLDLGWYGGFEDGLLVAAYHGAFHLVVEMPFDAALALGRDLNGVATAFVALYFGLVWIAVRMIARSTQARLRRALSRWTTLLEAPLA